jgi:gamma-glutamyltranspeptidase/glutathione hydrolase
MRDFHFPGRSAVHAMEAMVATSHPLATEAAMQILREGGTAMDAAITGSAVMAVVEPQMTGIGGDCFALVSQSGTGDVTAFNGSGRAPAAASVEALRDKGLTGMPVDSVHTVTLPGAIDGWFRLHNRFGRLETARLLQPAINYARHGYPVHARVARDWRQARTHLAKRDATRALFLPGGDCPSEGMIHRQERLADTLESIAKEGPRAFYEGRIAEAMLDSLRAHGGIHTADDFGAVAGEFVPPISTDYRGRTVHQVPPNNQGLTALMMLNLLEGFDLASYAPDSAERLHLEIETARLAYSMRDQHITDQDQMKVRIEDILSKGWADELRQRISPDRAMTDIGPLGLRTSDTVYMTVVDRDLNAVSFINSIFDSFGSGILCAKTGVLFQNRGHSFSLDRDHPNVLAPSKRPMHTIMPGMVTEKGKPALSFGVMGGDYQPIGQARVISNLFDHGLDLQGVLDAPRVFPVDGVVEVERSVPAEVLRGLADRGHTLRLATEPLGGAQAIRIDHSRGTLIGASDPRKDGCVAGY